MLENLPGSRYCDFDFSRQYGAQSVVGLLVGECEIEYIRAVGELLRNETQHFLGQIKQFRLRFGDMLRFQPLFAASLLIDHSSLH